MGPAPDSISTMLMFVIIGGTLAAAMVLAAYLNSYYPGSDHFIFVCSLITVVDKILEGRLLLQLWDTKGMDSCAFMLAATLCIAVVVNVFATWWLLSTTLRGSKPNRELAIFFRQNRAPASGIFTLAVLRLDNLQLLHAKLAFASGVTAAPLSEQDKDRIVLWGGVGIIAEDLPQFVVLLLTYSQMAPEDTNNALCVFVLTILSVLFSIGTRAVACITSGVSHRLSGRQSQTTLSPQDVGQVPAVSWHQDEETPHDPTAGIFPKMPQYEPPQYEQTLQQPPQQGGQPPASQQGSRPNMPAWVTWASNSPQDEQVMQQHPQSSKRYSSPELSQDGQPPAPQQGSRHVEFMPEHPQPQNMPAQPSMQAWVTWGSNSPRAAQDIDTDAGGQGASPPARRSTNMSTKSAGSVGSVSLC